MSFDYTYKVPCNSAFFVYFGYYFRENLKQKWKVNEKAIQLELFDFKDTPDTTHSVWCDLRDANGLIIRHVYFNEVYDPYVEGDADRALAKVERICQVLFNDGIISEAQISSTETRWLRVLWREGVVMKYYPDSPLSKADLDKVLDADTC